MDTGKYEPHAGTVMTKDKGPASDFENPWTALLISCWHDSIFGDLE